MIKKQTLGLEAVVGRYNIYVVVSRYAKEIPSMIMLAVKILGEQHTVAVLPGDQDDAPELCLRELSVLYDEYVRLGRTLTQYESEYLLGLAVTVH